jgi:hypothetical protein
MLIKIGTVIRPCPVGGNFAEQVQKGFTEVTMASGQKRRDPKYTGLYVEGSPFGYVTDTKAPIALEIDDEISIDAEFGTAYRVLRDGKEVWLNKELVEHEKEQSKVRARKWA